MFDNYLFVQYDYAQRIGEEGQMPHRKVLKVFPVERSELNYVGAADPDAICIFHRDERMAGAPGDPCPLCQTPLQAVAYRFNRAKLVIYVVEGELAITNPMLDMEFTVGELPVEQVLPAKKPKRNRSRAKSPVPVAEEAVPAVPVEVG